MAETNQTKKVRKANTQCLKAMAQSCFYLAPIPFKHTYIADADALVVFADKLIECGRIGQSSTSNRSNRGAYIRLMKVARDIAWDYFIKYYPGHHPGFKLIWDNVVLYIHGYDSLDMEIAYLVRTSSTRQ